MVTGCLGTFFRRTSRPSRIPPFGWLKTRFELNIDYRNGFETRYFFVELGFQ